ncbi:T9SS type A sorting domain-containing protein [Lentimicrobium sp. S6]|uniref:T9SS type A sorting domain-containing protein n=1 Tax=Lentimicrobium sp. S6 TaxID=2735872 RepID=UPI001556D66C|nr:T9SS type A sorting domain-containing protein [Lentimicrobium sp. S6]NPD47472.1 T9SS type A sorting domain-containing protein [Lentimicrobium sp. S6]
MKKSRVLLLIAITFFQINLFSQSLPDNIDISTSVNGIVPLPSTVPTAYITDGFVNYTKIPCSNGEAIHIIAQSNITTAQIVRARSILEFYLKDVPNSVYGADKSNVINTMGINDATLLLVNGFDDPIYEANVPGQPIYEEELVVEGHLWYQTNDYDAHRDATFEEILHMVHDMGIGVDGQNSISNPALPAFQTEIRNAQINANSNNFAIWPIGADGSDPETQNWYNELDIENSLSQEYLASVIDSYYGLWGAWSDFPDLGMWGMYIANDRSEIQTEDTMGWSVISKFFSEYINIDMIIDPSFNGIFSLTYNQTTEYTEKSRYLQHCYLSGTNTSGLQGNDLYNRLKGNSSDNTFEGLKGNDRLDGQGGSNTAIFTGNLSEYSINNLTTHAIITDNTANRDGIDTLWNMQFLQFADQTSQITIQNTVSVTAIKNNISNVSIYPNPSNDKININIPSNIDGINLEITNLSGKLVYKNSYNQNSDISLDITYLRNGLYIVSLKTKNSNTHLKFIKK